MSFTHYIKDNFLIFFKRYIRVFLANQFSMYVYM